MTNDVDLDAYFERIGWGGEAKPTYATLGGILAAHVDSIPFENFDVLLGRAPRLDAAGLQEKIVRARRGGYCFASRRGARGCRLFCGALRRASGSLRAGVRCAPRPHVPHRARRRRPLRGRPRFWHVGHEGAGAPRWSRARFRQADARMSQSDGLLTAWVVRDGAEAPGWVSTAIPETPIDFEVANHYTATHPRSPFVNLIMASAPKGRLRVNLMNAEATFLGPDGVKKRTLPDRRALRELVGEHFGFDLPELETMRVPAVPDWA